MKNNYEFSKSQRVAISFLYNFTEVISCWKNFIWFEKITLGEIKEISQDFWWNSYSKKQGREILFYGYRNILIAKVYLEGYAYYFNSDNTKPTFWKVVEVNYVNNYDESRIYLTPIWTKVQISEENQVLM